MKADIQESIVSSVTYATGGSLKQVNYGNIWRYIQGTNLLNVDFAGKVLPGKTMSRFIWKPTLPRQHCCPALMNIKWLRSNYTNILLLAFVGKALFQVDVKSLDAGPGVTKHVYVMEPDVPGGSVHPSILGMAHVRGDKEVILSWHCFNLVVVLWASFSVLTKVYIQVGATIVIPARAADSTLLFSVPGLMENQAIISNNTWLCNAYIYIHIIYVQKRKYTKTEFTVAKS